MSLGVGGEKGCGNDVNTVLMCKILKKKKKNLTEINQDADDYSRYYLCCLFSTFTRCCDINSIYPYFTVYKLR